jgi:hypothetical protein
MKIYTGRAVENLREVKLIDLVAESYRQNTDYKVNVDYHSDGSGSWISLIKETDKESKDLVIGFNASGTKIKDTGLYVTPIKKVLVDDESYRAL